MQSDELKRRISAGRGDALADLVFKNARIVNVFTDEIDTADIAISGNSIVGVDIQKRAISQRRSKGNTE